MCCMTDNAVGVLEDQSIWHYRQFAEFVAILQNRSLWFSRLDCLRDPFEGCSGRRSTFHEMADAYTRLGCVSCWSIGDQESELMWHAYAPGWGVAIRSTKAKLKSSIMPPVADKIVIGSVQYGIDWSQGPPDSYAFRKRQGFKQEQELRAFLPNDNQYDKPSGQPIEPTHSGKPV